MPARGKSWQFWDDWREPEGGLPRNEQSKASLELRSKRGATENPKGADEKISPHGLRLGEEVVGDKVESALTASPQCISWWLLPVLVNWPAARPLHKIYENKDFA